MTARYQTVSVHGKKVQAFIGKIEYASVPSSNEQNFLGHPATAFSVTVQMRLTSILTSITKTTTLAIPSEVVLVDTRFAIHVEV